mgnify:CR=1 FL=1
MSREIRVIHYGLGAIGSQIARLVLSREGMRSVAAIAGALGWELEAIEESLEPVIAEWSMRT